MAINRWRLEYHALLPTVDEDTLVKFQPSDVSNEMQYLKLGKVCGSDGIPNVCLGHLLRRQSSALLPPGTLEGSKPQMSRNPARTQNFIKMNV
jgi:hypothetical protein